MVKAELTAALEIAKSDRSLLEVDHSILHGLYLPEFRPVTTTLEVVARIIREVAIFLNGNVDNEELDQLSHCLRRKVTIIG